MSLQIIVLNTVFSLLLATNIVGNTLVILVILKNRTMKTAMNYLLLNLAVADVMVGALVAPGVFLMPMSAHPTGITGDILCKLITGENLAWLASLASAFTLVLVSFERYCTLKYPLDVHKKITKDKLVVVLPAVWLLATALRMPSFLAGKFDEESHSCSGKLAHHWQNVLYATAWMTCASIIPVGVMFVLYSVVVYSFWFKKSPATAVAARLVVRNSRKAITRMVITVSVVYALCCLPTHILYYYSYAFQPFPNRDLFFKISYVLVVLNSSVNPFVYIFQSAKFRRCLRKLMCCEGVENGQFLNETPENFTPPPRSELFVGEMVTTV